MHGTLEKDRTYSFEDIDLIEQLAALEARNNFWYFRRYMRPKMELGWFQREVAYKLQKFYYDWQAGRAPILALLTPPQHGKSWTMVDFLAWAQGHNPDSRAIFASFSEDLGVRANMWLQRIYSDPRYRRVFPNTMIASTSDEFQRNKTMLEYVGHVGSFRNTTVNGQINGQSLDLGVIDDPIKGRAEASSKLHRDKVWQWFTDDFFGRFSKDAAFVVTVTRWHIDDPVGRMQEHFGDRMQVLRYPALAEENEKYRKKDEALFPEIKPKKFLLERKALLTKAGWESIWQQSPIVAGGGMFPIEQFKMVNERPVPRDVRKTVRYWDKAGTEAGGAFTAGVLVDELRDGHILVSDVRRGQWSSFERETRIKQVAEMDNSGGRRCEIWVEQEPGSGGKESAERTVVNLRGHTVKVDRVTGSKEIRAEPYAAQVQAGNVSLLIAPWNLEFLDEHETFPVGTYKDQVDAAAGAFMKVTSGNRLSFANVV